MLGQIKERGLDNFVKAYAKAKVEEGIKPAVSSATVYVQPVARAVGHIEVITDNDEKNPVVKPAGLTALIDELVEKGVTVLGAKAVGSLAGSLQNALWVIPLVTKVIAEVADKAGEVVSDVVEDIIEAGHDKLETVLNKDLDGDGDIGGVPIEEVEKPKKKKAKAKPKAKA